MTMNIRVECYSGYQGEETPRYIWMGEKKIEVKEILDCWLAPEHRYFKFMDNDMSTYIIRHDTTALQWELTFFKQADAPTGVIFQEGENWV